MKQGKYQRKPVRRSNGTKLGLILLAVTMLIGSTIGGTFAYLMDQTEAVANTFTVGNVGSLTLTESNAQEVKEGDQVVGYTKSFMIVPGKDITKDPKVIYQTGEKNIDAYVFVKVTPATANGSYSWTLENGNYVIKGAKADGTSVNFLSWTVDNAWAPLTGVANVYYKEVDAAESLTASIISGDKITVSAYITEDNIAAVANAAGLTFTAYAIQADGFADAAAAWTAIK